MTVRMKYKLVRMKRKTLTICVKDGEVTVKAPKSMDMEHIENFVASKERWIERKLKEYAAKTDFLSGVVGYEQALYHGSVYRISVSSAVKRIKAEDGALLLPVKYSEDAAAARRAIASWYKREAVKELAERIYEISAATGLKYKSFCLTNARTKWGSCDAECNIRLNWRLIMLDAPLIDYVIVHELSHTVHHDHSAAFWAQVQKFYPDYKAARKRIKTYSVLTPLYR